MSLELRVVREPTLNGATFGVLFVDHRFQCFTLEDTIRERPGQPVSDWKISGRTAIPAGRYRVIVTPSQRFKRMLPLLVDVPGFTGVRIHPGNGTLDADGCLLVGRARMDGKVIESRLAFTPLLNLIDFADGEVWISIENPPIPERRAA